MEHVTGLRGVLPSAALQAAYALSNADEASAATSAVIAEAMVPLQQAAQRLDIKISDTLELLVSIKVFGPEGPPPGGLPARVLAHARETVGRTLAAWQRYSEQHLVLEKAKAIVKEGLVKQWHSDGARREHALACIACTPCIPYMHSMHEPLVVPIHMHIRVMPMPMPMRMYIRQSDSSLRHHPHPHVR